MQLVNVEKVTSLCAGPKPKTKATSVVHSNDFRILLDISTVGASSGWAEKEKVRLCCHLGEKRETRDSDHFDDGMAFILNILGNWEFT